MNKIIILLILAAIVFTGCLNGNSKAESLIGSWDGLDGSSITFNDNRTLVFISPGGITLTKTYIANDTHLTTTVGGFSTTSTYNIKEDKLTIITDGKEEIYMKK
jgi:hypothetical protein